MSTRSRSLPPPASSDSPEDAAAKFAGEVDGNVYSRYTNPTVRAFEKRLAALEQGRRRSPLRRGCRVLALCLTHLKAGDHVLCSRDVFGATVACSRIRSRNSVLRWALFPSLIRSVA